MLTEDENSRSIEGPELGHSILTLSEVVKTFEVESALFNIKLPNKEETRSVLLKKNKVEIDGETKMIIMINDVTAKVKLE